MPGKVKVRVLAGRNLPVMDKSSDTSDAFVEVKLGNTTYKTEVYRRSLNPFWKSEWFRFEVDDEELQDEPLQIRVMDYDTYSANDAIGKVYIDLNPLLSKDSRHVMSGWFPIYDTMHGIRGEINCVVKVALFSDANRYRQSSCGFKFFYSPAIPSGFTCDAIFGFVEELVVNHDPEYQWIDKIRTPRASNEARQALFSKISGEVQRKIGIKAIDLGGNAVVSYQQYFDMEGESGIVVRGIGTAVLLKKVESSHHSGPLSSQFVNTSESPNPNDDNHLASTSPPLNANITPTSVTAPFITPNKSMSPTRISHLGQRRLSEPDLTGTTPKGLSYLSGSTGSGRKYIISPESFHLLEYPFITMKSFPSNLILHIGGVVSARSVKLLDQINNPDDPETRDVWWTELRKEIRSHNRALACNAVLGYTESTYICDEICILSASGTAAVLKTGDSEHNISNLFNQTSIYTYDNKKDTIIENESNIINKNLKVDISLAQNHIHLEDKSQMNQNHCHLCHIPYLETSVPFPATLVKCMICKRAKVPDVLFMTIEPPEGIPTIGHGTLIQARVCRSKKDSKGEQCAKEISDGLPFLEYELHRQMLSKLKVKAMNALFNISIQVSFGENMLIAVATGTGAFLSPLSPPSPPKISSGKGIQCSKLNEIQSLITESIVKNREHYNLTTGNTSIQNGVNINENKEEDNEDPNDMIFDGNSNPKIDLNNGNKESCVLLEVDDTEDADIIALMIDSDVPKGYEICNSESLPGMRNQLICNLQMFTQVYRTKLTSIKQFGHQFDWIIQSLFVKYRRLIPCCLTDLKFRVDLPEADLVQITVVGTAIGIGPPVKTTIRSRKHTEIGDSELVFTMDPIDEQKASDQNVQNLCPNGVPYHIATTEHFGIELTPLSYIPSGQIESYLGNLDFFFIRESTSIREFGGLSGFIHSFLTEVFAIVRSHVSALGGNAMTSFHITQLLLIYNPHKNQSQCLVNVAGDAVIVRYDNKEKSRATSGPLDATLGNSLA
ncbi:C2 domain-containing protein 5-like [Oppia nitens]|uniref:C2 domain-containing protein 5-like n=1 Tax=Oppia nitens TaxID=1686743 RepID=UPI0023D9BD83|nr:C2 domain-containing protein 5-like [Oppia nitens]